MAKKRNKHQKDRKWQGGYRRYFENLDFAWLAEEFQKQATRNSDLTLEAFATRHGVQPEWISRFINTGKRTVVALWHGTTEDRARAIMEQGFRKRKGIYFAPNLGIALSIATTRAQGRDEIPVVISCRIDSERYLPGKSKSPIISSSGFISNSGFQIVFHCPIGREVICNVSIMDKGQFFKRPRKKRGTPISIDVDVSKASGKRDVLSWLNCYLSLGGEEAISEDHPAVEAALKWVEAQYAQGREEPISDEEMLSLVMILRSVPGLEMDKWGNQLPKKGDTGELVDVVITQNSGKLGVLYWINCYLELNGKEAVSEEHPAVEAIFKWVEAQYAQGRDEPISDEEMLTQVMTHMKQE